MCKNAKKQFIPASQLGTISIFCCDIKFIGHHELVKDKYCLSFYGLLCSLKGFSIFWPTMEFFVFQGSFHNSLIRIRMKLKLNYTTFFHWCWCLPSIIFLVFSSSVSWGDSGLHYVSIHLGPHTHTDTLGHTSKDH